jgi:hypothetical protein
MDDLKPVDLARRFKKRSHQYLQHIYNVELMENYLVYIRQLGYETGLKYIIQ